MRGLDGSRTGKFPAPDPSSVAPSVREGLSFIYSALGLLCFLNLKTNVYQFWKICMHFLYIHFLSLNYQSLPWDSHYLCVGSSSSLFHSFTLFLFLSRHLSFSVVFWIIY